MIQRILFFLFILFLLGCNEQETEPSFSLQDGESEIILASDANATTLIHFSSTCAWQAQTSSDWLDISPVSGEAGTYQMALTASSANNSNVSRTATVNLISDNLTQSFTVTQSAAEYVELEQTTYYAEAEGTSLQINFSTNVSADELSVYGTVDWLTQPTKGRSSTQYTINLTVEPNTEANDRTAYLYFYQINDQKENLLNCVTIIQYGTNTHTSTDYSADKTVHILQKATKGNGLPIVLMGDGFLDTDIENGTYDTVMNKAMENLFTEEPIKSLRNYFNVYSVTAVSLTNRFDGHSTTFECETEGGMSTLIYGNDEKVMDYIQCVDGIDLAETLAIVILNSSVYAGTTYFGYSYNNQMTELAIAYCPIIYDIENESFRQVLVHEAIGHGFAKLEDEYSYAENGEIPSSEKQQVETLQSYGWAKNVDFTPNATDILWSDFLTDSYYISSENIGVYEGACTYITGVYRPTKDSMMNTNTCGFNAPSRKAIYDKVMKKGENKEITYKEFTEFDSQITSQSRIFHQTSTSSVSRRFAPPHFVNRAFK